MSSRYAKIISGGRPVGAAEQEGLAREQLIEMKARLVKPPLPKTDNIIDQRVAEELRSVQRTIEQVQTAVERVPGGIAPAKALQHVESVIDDLATVVDAHNQCDGLARAAPELKRRLQRRAIGDQPGPCDNR